MSGVELLGLGAGLVSLALQLGDCAIRLKKLYHTAKDAPERLRRVSFELETMTAALDQIQVHRHIGNHSDHVLTRCMEGCQQSVMDIEGLVTKLESKMSRFPRGAGRLYTAMRGDDIRALLDELDRSRSSLQLAYMMYISEEQRRRDKEHMAILLRGRTDLQNVQSHLLASGPTRDIVQEQASLVTDGNEGSSIPGESYNESEVLKLSRNRDRRDFTHEPSVTQRRMKISLPQWLCSRIWDMALIYTQSRWTMHLTTYNKIPEDAPVLEHIWQNDMEGLRKILADGFASPLDIFEHKPGHTWTLLETAAQVGHYEICAFLLKSTAWPDEVELLMRALEWSTYSKGCNADMYRLFLGSVSSNISLDEVDRRYVWMAMCRSPECFDIIQRELLPNFYEDTVQARFELAVRTSSTSECAVFLSRIGLRRQDPRLAMLKDMAGRTVLHCVAARLWNLAYKRYPPEEVRDWIELGIHVLQNGADPHAISKPDPEYLARSALVNDATTHETLHPSSWAGTPLLECLDIVDWRISPWSHLWLAMRLENLRTWVGMIKDAGYDLLNYGAKEKQIWREIGIDQVAARYNADGPLPCNVVDGLVISSSSARWDLRIRWSESRPLRQLSSVPGSIFQSPQAIPRMIAWTPSAEEEAEGPWSVICRTWRFQDPAVLADVLGQYPEPFVDLVDDVQDDSGAVVLLTVRAARMRDSSKRSHSTPAPLQHRWSAHCPPQRSRPWLPSYHLCPETGRWELTCIASEHHRIDDTPDLRFPRIRGHTKARLRYFRNRELKSFAGGGDLDVRARAQGVAFDMRACVQGRADRFTSVQELRTWQKAGFLSAAYRRTLEDPRASVYTLDSEE